MESTARPSEVAELELVARLRAGNDQAFEECVRRFGGRLLAVARRFLDNEEDAQDAVQDAFLSACKAINRFEGKSRLATWLHRITVNCALLKLRQRKHREERSIEDLLPKFLDDGHQAEPAVDWADPLDVVAQRQEMRGLVRAAISQLPETYRSVLLLRDIEGLDTEETARLLEVNPGAVKTRLHRARQVLRALLAPHFAGELT